MKLLKHATISVCLLGSALLLFLLPEVSRQSISDGLALCARSILPSLFPFFVLSNLWITLGYAQKLSHWLAPWMGILFHLPGDSASALLLGAIGGYPVGAQTAAHLYQEKHLTQEDVQRTLFFCNNAGPAFLFGIIGGGLFQNATIAAILWAIHLGSSLLLGILFRPSKFPVLNHCPCESETHAFLPSLTSSIQQAGQTALMICIFVLLFSILSGYLQAIFPSINTSVFGTILLGSLELAGGCCKLGVLGLSQEQVFVACAGLLGWGGLCVHCQTLSALSKVGLSARQYFTGKVLHALVSLALACLIAPTLPLHVPCFAVTEYPPVGAITLLLSLLFLLILKSSSGKLAKYRL